MLSNREIIKLASLASKERKVCRCGHRQLLGTQDRVICKHCGNYIYKDDRTEFEYKLLERRKKNEI